MDSSGLQWGVGGGDKIMWLEPRVFAGQDPCPIYEVRHYWGMISMARPAGSWPHSGQWSCGRLAPSGENLPSSQLFRGQDRSQNGEGGILMNLVRLVSTLAKPQYLNISNQSGAVDRRTWKTNHQFCQPYVPTIDIGIWQTA